MATAIQSAMAKIENPQEHIENLLSAIQNRDPEEQEITAKQAVGLIRRAAGK